MKMVAPRHLGSTLAVALLLFGFADAHAGTKEINAILAELPSGKTIQTATNAELSKAVRDAYADAANSKLKPENIAAEALKGANTAAQIGFQLAQDILNDLSNQTIASTGLYPKIAANVQKFVGLASKGAATGTGADASQIQDWARVFITQTPEAGRNNDAILMAKSASGSPTAQGAIMGGRALIGDASIDTDVERAGLVNQAITAKLSGAVQQMAQYVGDYANDPGKFAAGLTALGKNTSHLVKIVTGTTTSNSTRASEIVNEMFIPGGTGDTTTSPVYLATVKNSSKLAKNLGLIADTEEVSQMAVELGKRVGTTVIGTNGKPKVVGIPQSKVNGLATALVTGLTTRSNASARPNEDVSRKNRLDEIGEIGGYMLAAIKGLPVFTVNSPANLKGAPNLIVGLMKTIISASAKVHRDAATGEAVIPPKGTTVKAPIFQGIAAEDLAGTIALTLRTLEGDIDDSIYAAIKAVLTADGIGKKIAGGSSTLITVDGVARTIAAHVEAALDAILLDPELNLGVLDTKYMKYENGTVSNVNDPETDIRNH